MASLAPNPRIFVAGDQPAPVLESCALHDHLCLIYDTQQEQLAAAVPFLRIGLEHGEKCIYVADENPPSVILEAMRVDGIDVEAAIDSGALTILTRDQAYLKNGAFDPGWMIGFLREQIELAEAHGFTSFRITGEITWALPPLLDPLIEYECRLNDFFPHHNLLALCQYNRNRFPPETLLHVLHLHPLVVHRGLVCDNPHYIPPEAFVKEEHDPAAHLQRLLDSIIQNAQLKQRLAAETEALRESEQKFRTIVDTSPECVKLVAADGSLLHMNPSGLAMIGAHSAGEVLGKSFYTLVAPEDREAFRAFSARVCQGEKRLLRFDIVTLEGVRRHMESHAAPLRTPDGQTVLLALTHDATERKRAEDLLLEQNRILELIATGCPLQESLTAITASVARLRPNARSAVLLADESRTAMKRVFSADLPPSFEQGIRGAPISDLAIGTCGTAIFEGRPVTCADIANDTQWSKPWRDLCMAHGAFACHSTPVFDSNQNSIASFFLCFGEAHEPDEWERGIGQFGAHLAGIAIEREVSRERRKKSDAALRKSEKFAAAGRMAATVAHEINNPLESVINLCYLLGDENLPPSARDLLHTLDDELDRIARITRQTLGFYREGKTAGPLDLAEPINAAITLFSRKAELQGTTIQTLFRSSATVYGFSGELRQVFANLISNSLEAGATAIKIRVSPTLSTSPARVGVSVLVTDNGSGIGPEPARKLFQPFFTTKEEKGTGLGLWVSKGIMQKHEGSIHVRTSTRPACHGTSFRLFLPTLEPRS